MKNSILLSLVILCLFGTKAFAQVNSINGKPIRVTTPSKEVSGESLGLYNTNFKNGQLVGIQSAADPNLFLAAWKGQTKTHTLIVVHNQLQFEEDIFQWKLEKTSNGWFHLRNMKSNRVLHIKEEQPNSGISLWLRPKDKTESAQKFRFRPFDLDPSLHFIQTKLVPTLYLDIRKTAPKSGTEVMTNHFENGRRTQKWKIIAK